MYCAYVRSGEGGPLLLKTPTGQAVAAFATSELLRHFLAKKPSTLPTEAVEVSQLRSIHYPMPEQWRGVRQALLFDSASIIEQFLADAKSFPYEKHIVTLA